MTKLRVGLVPYDSTTIENGVNRYLLALDQQFRQLDGIEATIVRDDRGLRRPEVLSRLAKRLPPSSSLLRTFDIVHVPLERLRFASRLATRPLVVTVTGLGGLSGSYDNVAARRADLAFLDAFERIRGRVELITNTEATRDHVCSTLRLDESSVHVVPLGVDLDMFSPARSGPPDSATVGPPEIMCVGRFSARKNTAVLIEALRLLRDREHVLARLVFVGRVDRHAVLRAAVALGLEDQVETTGRLTDAELVARYRRAAVVAVPSRYEGFGLPPLEAMACGTPVLISGSPAMSEVSGSAALVVDDIEDPSAVVQGLGRILTDPDLAQDLARRGRDLARRFSWAICAQRHLEVYEHCLDASPIGSSC